MSTSSTYVKWAAVTLDFAIFSKMRFLSPWIGIRCSTPLEAAAETGGAATVVLTGPCAALRTSSSVRRPCGPLPRTAARFTLSSFARRRTAGAARTSPEGPGAGGATVMTGGGGAEAGRVVSGLGGAISPASPNTTRVLPTLTTSPSFARSWRIFPVTGEGIWTVTLSVMTSTIGSFSLTASPSFTNHLTTSPSWTPSPMSGSLNSRAIFSRSATVASPAADLTFCTLRCPGAYSRCESFYGHRPMSVRGGVGSWGSGTERWACFVPGASRRKDSRPAPPFCDIGGSDNETSGRDIHSWWARALGGCDPSFDFDRELHRRTRFPAAVPERWADVTGNAAPAQRGPIFRDRGRPRNCGIGAPADARVGVRARGSRHTRHPRLRGLHRVRAVELRGGSQPCRDPDPRNRRRDFRVPARGVTRVPSALWNSLSGR